MATDALKTLIELVPPPVEPVGAEDSWEQVETELGMALPQDYRALVATYGAGTACDLLEWPSPSRYLDEVANCLQTLRHEQEMGFTVATPLWPEPGGLLPWAQVYEEQGNFHFMWRCATPDAAWPVVFDDGTSVSCHVAGAATDVVLFMVSGGDVGVEGWAPSTWLDGRTTEPWFQPTPHGLTKVFDLVFDRPPHVFTEWVAAVASLFSTVTPRYFHHYDAGMFDLGQASFHGDGQYVRVNAGAPRHFSVSFKVPAAVGRDFATRVDLLPSLLGCAPLQDTRRTIDFGS